MKVTTDTNVLVSGTFWTGDSYRVLSLIKDNKIELIISEDILEEYYDVTGRDEIIEKIMNKKLILSEIADKIIESATIVAPKEKIDIVKEDPDDNKIIECAIEGNVNYIISQDNHLLKIKEYKGIKILTPKDFLETI